MREGRSERLRGRLQRAGLEDGARADGDSQTRAADRREGRALGRAHSELRAGKIVTRGAEADHTDTPWRNLPRSLRNGRSKKLNEENAAR